MSEELHGRIFIGGKVSKATFKKIVDKFFDEGFQEETFKIAEGGGVFVQGDDYDACNGQFEGLEVWLIEHKVSFLRESAGDDGDWKPEVLVYDTESNRHYSQITDENHRPIINYEQLHNFVKELAGKSPEDLPMIALKNDDGTWLHQFASEGLTGSMDLATFLTRKLDEYAIPSPPTLTVVGMSDEEVLQALNDKLDEN